MRVIDADALLERMRKDPLFPLVERYGVSGVIDAEPTVEPKTGKWKPYPITDGCIQCSVCGILRVGEPSNYCPNCGAKMEGEKNE